MIYLLFPSEVVFASTSPNSPANDNYPFFSGSVENGATRILLRGAQDATYTAFVHQDPPRLIVELPDARFEGVSSPIPVGCDP